MEYPRRAFDRVDLSKKFFYDTKRYSITLNNDESFHFRRQPFEMFQTLSNRAARNAFEIPARYPSKNNHRNRHTVENYFREW